MSVMGRELPVATTCATAAPATSWSASRRRAPRRICRPVSQLQMFAREQYAWGIRAIVLPTKYRAAAT
jgi:hypothetical protein